MLVFSKTSVQSIRIGPNTPRMLYFNDSVAVGTVKGGAIELAAQDPQLGMVFYILDQNPSRYREWAARPKPRIPLAPRGLHELSPFESDWTSATAYSQRPYGVDRGASRSIGGARNGQPDAFQSAVGGLVRNW